MLDGRSGRCSSSAAARRADQRSGSAKSKSRAPAYNRSRSSFALHCRKLGRMRESCAGLCYTSLTMSSRSRPGRKRWNSCATTVPGDDGAAVSHRANGAARRCGAPSPGPPASVNVGVRRPGWPATGDLAAVPRHPGGHSAPPPPGGAILLDRPGVEMAPGLLDLNSGRSRGSRSPAARPLTFDRLVRRYLKRCWQVGTGPELSRMTFRLLSRSAAAGVLARPLGPGPCPARRSGGSQRVRLAGTLLAPCHQGGLGAVAEAGCPPEDAQGGRSSPLVHPVRLARHAPDRPPQRAGRELEAS